MFGMGYFIQICFFYYFVKWFFLDRFIFLEDENISCKVVYIVKEVDVSRFYGMLCYNFMRQCDVYCLQYGIVCLNIIYI